MNVEVKTTITITIGNKTIEVTDVEAKALQARLNTFFGDPWTHVYCPSVWTDIPNTTGPWTTSYTITTTMGDDVH